MARWSGCRSRASPSGPGCALGSRTASASRSCRSPRPAAARLRRPAARAAPPRPARSGSRGRRPGSSAFDALHRLRPRPASSETIVAGSHVARAKGRRCGRTPAQPDLLPVEITARRETCKSRRDASDGAWRHSRLDDPIRERESRAGRTRRLPTPPAAPRPAGARAATSPVRTPSRLRRRRSRRRRPASPGRARRPGTRSRRCQRRPATPTGRATRPAGTPTASAVTASAAACHSAVPKIWRPTQPMVISTARSRR